MPTQNEEMPENHLDQPATRRDLRALHGEVVALEERLKRHFDVVAEQFKTEFNTLYDWTKANTSSLDKRVEAIETGRGAKLAGIETRLLVVERRRTRKRSSPVDR